MMPTITEEERTDKGTPTQQDGNCNKAEAGQQTNSESDDRKEASPEQSQAQKQEESGKQGSSEEEDDSKQEEKKPPMSPAKKAGIIMIGVAFAVVLLIGLVLWFLHTRTYEDTDDAQINGHISNIAARIDGTVLGVAVENNQSIEAGQLLVQLDAKDYQVAYDQANARLLQANLTLKAARPNLSITRNTISADTESANGDVASAQAVLAAAEHDVAQADARLRQSIANNLRAQNDLARYKLLVEKDEVSQQQYDQYLATARAEQATVEADEAGVSSARQTVLQRAAMLHQQRTRLAETKANGPQQEEIRSADIGNQQAGAAVARSALERDQLNLMYTHIVSPISGIVMLRTVEIGDRVSVGQRLLQVVQIDNLWVDANFKETQLRKMHPGLKVTVRVDSLKEDFEGAIDAMPAATGDRASLFPAENATGNFVKVVQRLPVRIRLKAGQKDLDRLRPGMSVEPKVSLD